MTLTQFMEFCKEHGDHKFIMASGWDHFYANKNDEDAFCRVRVGPDSNQLTFKRKTDDANNYIRTEHNIDLATTVSVRQAADLAKEFGYYFKFTLYKNCFVFKYDRYTFVYYIVYDPDLNERGRFVEIEMSESYPWKDDQEAWGALTVLEKIMKPMGILPQGRVKRSLYEMFKDAK
jgi:adenylate cyclase class IV